MYILDCPNMSKGSLKMTKRKPKLKTYNVFYTQPACQHEVIVKAKSLKEAVAIVERALTDSVESITGGWECKE